MSLNNDNGINSILRSNVYVKLHIKIKNSDFFKYHNYNTIKYIFFIAINIRIN